MYNLSNIVYAVSGETEAFLDAEGSICFALSNSIGYQLFNLISMDINEIEKKIDTDDTKSDNSDDNILASDTVEYLHIPVIKDEYFRDRDRFLSDILLIKMFFEMSDIANDENELPFSLDGLMLFAGYNGLKIPYHHWLIPGIRVNDYTKILITSKNYDKILREIKNSIDINLFLFSEEENHDVYSYECNRILDLCLSCLHYILANGYTVKKCAVCNKYFVAKNRSDTLYCDRTSPNDKTKTCKEYGAIKAYQDNLKTNEAMGLYRKIYMSKQMLAKRHPEIKEYSDAFEAYKVHSKQWKKDVKEGKKTEADYIEWLKSVKKKKVNINE